MNRILKHKKGWTERMELSNSDYRIQQLIDKLDQRVRWFEAIWGVSKLEQLVPQELAQKFERQKEKLNEAIRNSDLMGVEELVPGTVRGFEALDKAARAEGHKPHGAGEAWTARMPNGKELAICATLDDALVIQAKANPDNNLVIWTLEEVANVLSNKNLVSVTEKKLQTQASGDEKKFDFEHGDTIPW